MRRVLLLAVLLLGAGCTDRGPAIRIADPWSRPTGGTLPGVVYLSIVNAGDTPDRLVGLRSDCCETLEIHRTIIENTRMSMAPVGPQGITVAPGTTVALAPGGYHLMLFGLKEPLRRGMRFEIVLAFEHSGEIPVTVEVRDPR
jgi:copper(I)-binding protein